MKLSRFSFILLSAFISVSAVAESNFSWVQSYKGKHSYDFTVDARAKELVTSTAKTKNCAGKEVASEIWESLSGPGEQITFVADRFATVHACRKHACHEISMVWIDTKDSKAAAAFVSLLGGPVYVTSRDFSADNLPVEFLNSLRNWMAEIKWGKDRPSVEFCTSENKLDPIGKY